MQLETPEFTEAEIKEAALQTFQEILWALRGDLEATKTHISKTAMFWLRAEKMMAETGEGIIPNWDPELAKRSIFYLNAHFNTIAQDAIHYLTLIDPSLAIRVGLQKRVDDSLSDPNDSSIIINSKKLDPTSIN